MVVPRSGGRNERKKTDFNEIRSSYWSGKLGKKLAGPLQIHLG